MPDIKKEVIDSWKPVKELLNTIFQRLSLKGKKFETFDAVSEEKIMELWDKILSVDSSVTRKDTTQKELKKKPDLTTFLDTHCCKRQYMFSVKKCGSEDCGICGDVRLPRDIFSGLFHLPDPTPHPVEKEHYKDFEYGTETNENHLPSLHEKKIKGHGMEYSPMKQTTKNV